MSIERFLRGNASSVFTEKESLYAGATISVGQYVKIFQYSGFFKSERLIIPIKKPVFDLEQVINPFGKKIVDKSPICKDSEAKFEYQDWNDWPSEAWFEFEFGTVLVKKFAKRSALCVDKVLDWSTSNWDLDPHLDTENDYFENNLNFQGYAYLGFQLELVAISDEYWAEVHGDCLANCEALLRQHKEVLSKIFKECVSLEDDCLGRYPICMLVSDRSISINVNFRALEKFSDTFWESRERLFYEYGFGSLNGECEVHAMALALASLAPSVLKERLGCTDKISVEVENRYRESVMKGDYDTESKYLGYVIRLGAVHSHEEVSKNGLRSWF